MGISSDAVLSLFSGAGGFSFGFASAGLKPMCGAEIDKDACATYEENIGSPCHKLDLGIVSPAYFHKILGGRRPFALIGGPPCQGFSTAGARRTNDSRNALIFNYLKIVDAVKPRWFVFENVEGLLTSGTGDAIWSLVSEFLRIGYCVRLQKTNFAAFGVPQTRKRVLIIGNSFGADFPFPQEICSYDSGKSRKQSEKPFAPTLADAVDGLPRAQVDRSIRAPYSCPASKSSFDERMRMGNFDSLVTEHYDATSSEDAARYRLLSAGQTMKDLPQEFWHDSYRRRAFRRVMDGTPTEKRGGAPSGIKRLTGNLQSLTITGAASREFIHPTFDRPLTPRECARIQSFPDRYQFRGGAQSVMQQIGNAVPPIGAEAIANHIRNLDGMHGSGLAPLPAVRAPQLLGYVLTESVGMSDALKRTDGLLRELMQPGLDLRFG